MYIFIKIKMIKLNLLLHKEEKDHPVKLVTGYKGSRVLCTLVQIQELWVCQAKPMARFLFL